MIVALFAIIQGEAQQLHTTTTTKELFTVSGKNLLVPNYYDSTSLEITISRPDTLYTEVRRKLNVLCNLDENCEYRTNNVLPFWAFSGFLRGDIELKRAEIDRIAKVFKCTVKTDEYGNLNLFLNRELREELPAAYGKQ